MTHVPEDKLKKVAADIEEVLVKEKMALQPYMNRTIQGTFAAVRLVSTEEEEVPSEDLTEDKTDSNVEKGTDSKEVEGDGDTNGASKSK